MSTEMIRRVLYNARRGITSCPSTLAGAEAEVEAIEKAADVLTAAPTGPFVPPATRERLEQWRDAHLLLQAIAAQRNAGTE